MNTISPTEELSLLRKRRVALEQAIQVATTVADLHQGLKAAQAMSNPTAAIPQQFIATLDELDEAHKIAPSSKLKESLERLEQSTNEKLATIIKIVAMDEKQLAASLASTGNKKDQITDILLSYSKDAKTALAIKMLLRSRGEITKPTNFLLSADSIKHELAQVSTKEQQCRKVVRQEMVIIIDDTKRILKRDDLPDAMREMLQATQDDFQSNLEHLDAGKSITTLPAHIEVVEMGEHRENEDKEPDKQAMPEEAAKPTISPDENHGKQHGFFYKLWRWISTPLNVEWGDIEQEIKQSKKKK